MTAAIERQHQLLLIEDNWADFDLMTERLAETPGASFGVNRASSLAQAFPLIEEGRFDAILLDLNLPDSAGLDTLSAVRQCAPQATIVVVTGQVTDQLRQEALALGAAEVISKNDFSTRLFSTSVLYLMEYNRALGEQRSLEKLLSVAPDAIVVVAESGPVRYVNDAALRLLGRPRLELVGKLPGFALGQASEPTEVTVESGGQTRLCELRVVDLSWNGEKSFLATLRDITEQRQMETQLAISDRMSTMGTLAAGVAHEINNPLTAVIGYLEVATFLLREIDGTEMALGHLGQARDAADRVRVIVGDLKLLSRPEDEKIGPVDVHEVIASSLRMAWNETRHRAQVVSELQPVPPVRANDARLGQILLNLIINAAQAIPEGNKADNEIRVTTRVNESGEIVIEVSDTGCGIPLEIQPRVFQAFFTTKPIGVGTGLGLAICQRLVNSFGGRLEFRSQPGVGTRFQVLLPPAEPASAPPAAQAQAPAPAAPRGRVLVVDDDEPILRVTELLLAGEHDVLACTEATRALEHLQAGEEFDVIVCDLMMPQVTGMEFYERVRALGRGQEERILFVTGGAFTPAARAFLESVPNQRLDKPYNPRVLKDHVNGTVRARRA